MICRESIGNLSIMKPLSSNIFNNKKAFYKFLINLLFPDL